MAENNYNISKVFLKLNQMLWKNAKLQNIRSAFFVIDDALLLNMKKPAENETTGRKKVLVVYNMALGDGIMISGVIKDLRRIYPEDEFELSIACQKAFKQLYEDSGIFDYVIPMDFSGSVANLKKRRELFQELRRKTYDIVLDPVGCEDCTTNVFITRAAIAKEKIGVLDTTIPHQMTDKQRKKIYTKIVRVNIPKIHLIRYYAAFLSGVGNIKVKARPATLPDYDLSNLDPALPEKFFIVFPIASMSVKKWSEQNFAEIAERIQKKTGWKMVVCGTEHDRPSIEKMLSYIPNIDYIDVIGQTSILSFTSLIGKASLVVTNDTSAYHIAVARKVPTVMAAGGYTYHRYAYYDYREEGFPQPKLACHKMDCFDCNNHCIYSDYEVFPCLEKVTVDDVWEKIQELEVF